MVQRHLLAYSCVQSISRGTRPTVPQQNSIAHKEVSKVPSVRARQALVIFSFLLLFAVLDTLNQYVTLRGQGLAVINLYLYEIVFWAPFFVAVPGILLLVDRYRLESWRSLGLSIFIHAIAGLVFTYLHVSIISPIDAYLDKAPVRGVFFKNLQFDFAFDYLGYGGMAVIAYALRYYSEFSRRQSEARLEERVQERMRISRELHDTVLQSLHGLLMSFQRAANLLPDRPVEAKERLESAIDQAAQAITEGREAVQGLRSSTVVTDDLAVAIQTLGEELAGQQISQGAPLFDVAVEGTPRYLNPILRDDVYRIAGEAMRNAFHHAQARRIEVEIQYDKSHLRLRVRDDGKGVESEVFTQGRSGHWGLQGMRERTKLLGGQLEVWSQLDSGTEIQLSIPASIAYLTSPSRQTTKSMGANL
jgi:signal transduction histidine kinase